jgi:AcrR family transcriptional regulator
MDDPEPKREGGRAARRASDTHQRLLQAALSVFNGMGFDGCAIEDITEKADVGKGTFYRHFHDKHAILASLVSQAVNDIESRMAKAITPSTSQADIAAKIIRSHIAMFREHRDLFLLFLQAQELMAARRDSLPELQSSFAHYWKLVESQFAGTQPLNASPENTRLLAAVVSGSVFGIIMAGLSSMSKEMVEGKVETLCNAIVAGIGQPLR